ncbi:MAG: rod shape-determining protein RodA [Clostridiales bacterium]|nr:rod shape-determining protein RodA [Clostridiales bacterium]
MKSGNSANINQFDSLLFILTLLAAFIGLIAIYSATLSLNSNTQIIVQSGAFLMGIVAMILISKIDYQVFGYISVPIYIVCIIMLIAVLVIGSAGDWGARSWIRFGPIGIQPSEICKVGFTITFAKHLSLVKNKINTFTTVLALLAHLVILLALIMLQPDAGSAMVFCFMFAVMIFTAGISFKYIIPSVLVLLSSAPLVYFFLLSDYQKHRIQVFFNPEMDKLGSGYNVIQSKIAVGSGQLFGKGYLKGTQNQMGFLPTKHTDFIFSVISEEFGFIGAVFVILLLFLIIARCIKAAQDSNDLFGKYICIGIAAMLIFHTFENMGMCIGLMPVTGIPLPFISYGGTSLLTNFIAIGIVLSVSRHSHGTKLAYKN